MIRQLLIFALVFLLTATSSRAQGPPCVQSNMKPFDPTIGVTFWVDPVFAAQEPFLYECIRQGLELWNGAATPVNFTSNILQANVRVLQVNANVFQFPGTPSGAFDRETNPQSGFQTGGTISLANNLLDTAGFYNEGGCQRIMKLAAHELGHGYFGDNAVHTAGNSNSIMRPGNHLQLWGGLDFLPLGPTACDREQEQRGRTREKDDYQSGGAGDFCAPGAFQDSHGCPCSALFIDWLVPAWASYNHLPYGHIEWPYSGVHAPFSGNLIHHSGDADGHVWFTDWFVNSQYLLRTYGNDAGFPFNASPGSYYIEQAVYDNRGQYHMGTPKQINICGGPPAQVNPVYHWVSGGYVGVYWTNPSPGWVTGFAIEGGTYPGGSNLGTWTTGDLGYVAGPVGPGTYYVRVKAYNPCGVGTASPEVVVTVP